MAFRPTTMSVRTTGTPVTYAAAASADVRSYGLTPVTTTSATGAWTTARALPVSYAAPTTLPATTMTRGYTAAAPPVVVSSLPAFGSIGTQVFDRVIEPKVATFIGGPREKIVTNAEHRRQRGSVNYQDRLEEQQLLREREANKKKTQQRRYAERDRKASGDTFMEDGKK